MAINRWRHCEYDGDGCDGYQCLMCYKRLAVRGWSVNEWRFCPFCGTKWEGPPMPSPPRKDRPWVEPKAVWWWVIERRRQNVWPKEEDNVLCRDVKPAWGRWEVCEVLDPRHPAREVLARLKLLRWEANDPAPIFSAPDEYRLKTVRTLPDYVSAGSHLYRRWYGPRT